MRTSKGAESTLDMSSRTPNSIGMDVPVMSAIRACHQVVPGMLSSGVGSIINILTPASYFPLPWMAPYTASRWALNGFSQSLYLELKGQGIHVGSLCPGRVDTDYIARNSTDFGWWPLIACIFPTLTTERVAERVLLGIRKQRREQIFPLLLWVFVRAFGLFPKTVLRVLEWTRLLQPPALADSNHTRQTEQPITIDNATNWEESIQLNIIDESDPGLLQALRSSYGLFGVICDVTFRVQ